MSEDEAITIAEQKARDLNMPWSRDGITVTRRRLWPFPAFWRIVARVKSDGAIVSLDVSERTRSATPRRVLYPAGGLV
jgi:hypothetical protein